MLLDPRTWALAHRIDDLLPRLPRGHAGPRHRRDARLRVRDPDRRRRDRRRGDGRAALRCGTELERDARDARPAGRRRRDPPLRDLAGDRGLRRRALPVRLRLDARARPPRADLRAARPRRRRATPRPRSGSTTGCAFTCRCCWRCRPTRPSGRGGTRASPRRGRRSSRPSRGSGCRARSAATRPTPRPSTC